MAHRLFSKSVSEATTGPVLCTGKSGGELSTTVCKRLWAWKVHVTQRRNLTLLWVLPQKGCSEAKQQQKQNADDPLSPQADPDCRAMGACRQSAGHAALADQQSGQEPERVHMLIPKGPAQESGGHRTWPVAPLHGAAGLHPTPGFCTRQH